MIYKTMSWSEEENWMVWTHV